MALAAEKGLGPSSHSEMNSWHYAQARTEAGTPACLPAGGGCWAGRGFLPTGGRHFTPALQKARSTTHRANKSREAPLAQASAACAQECVHVLALP
eukprot:CAMPEP_0175705772 /NCGR_PEP_ID=MMETSP0097-20121207/37708_1 /TAXON_ID=311494 /ORGANISM="Alexandrium monilatum, Strain CCMP3105" /LENGTH=95 /DNA_ID=CAMNT_0017013109 /DNA_START=32 /DNA_END=315 /DNA_ORIENTATION=+